MENKTEVIRELTQISQNKEYTESTRLVVLRILHEVQKEIKSALEAEQELHDLFNQKR